MVTKFDIDNALWTYDLIGCPSQCYYYFKYNGITYCLYLRWRWDDPWTATLIEDCEVGNIIDGKWIELGVEDWLEDELNDLKTDALWCAKTYLDSLP